MLRWVLYAIFAYIVYRVIQATLRVLQDTRSVRREDDPLGSAPAAPPIQEDLKNIEDADFEDLPPKENKADDGGKHND
jgi:hypothetical protein